MAKRAFLDPLFPVVATLLGLGMFLFISNYHPRLGFIDNIMVDEIALNGYCIDPYAEDRQRLAEMSAREQRDYLGAVTREEADAIVRPYSPPFLCNTVIETRWIAGAWLVLLVVHFIARSRRQN